MHEGYLLLTPLQHGAEDVKNHKWFKGINWDHVLQRGLMVSPTPNTHGLG